MVWKPVGVSTETSLFPERVMTALKNLFLVKSDASVVAISGRYEDLSNKPSIPSSPSSIGAEPVGLSSATQSSLDNKYVAKNAQTVAPQVFTQSISALSWTFTHNLGRVPFVAVYNADNIMVFPDIQVTASTITLTFAVAAVGSVILI